MKRRFILSGLIFLFLIMLIFPKLVFAGASEGLLLWFQIVLPTLLPFIIICNLLVHTNAIAYISRIVGPFTGRFFGVSHNGAFAVLTGFLCGYPMGAKVTADLVLEKRISLNEGRYLLSFCNNTSPMFIMSYVVWQNLGRDDLIVPSLIILFLSPILMSFPFRLYYRKGLLKDKHTVEAHTASPKGRLGFDVLDSCIMNGFETITKVGGYIILFSVLLALLKEIPAVTSLWSHILLPSLEITNGVPMICRLSSGFPVKFMLVLALTSFGGFCSIAQTQCMLGGTELKIGPYIIQKLITALATSFIAYLYILF